MASKNYSIGYQVHARVKKTITWNIPYFQNELTISGNDYVLTYETNTFTLTPNATFTIETVTATNCTSSFNSSTGVLTLTNVTGNVAITVTIAGTTLTLELGQRQAPTQPPTYQYIGGGTVYYKDKYGQDQVLTIPDRLNQRYKKLILLHSTCICENIIHKSTSPYGVSDTTFGQGPYEINNPSPNHHYGGHNECLQATSGLYPANFTFTDCVGPWIVIDVSHW